MAMMEISGLQLENIFQFFSSFSALLVCLENLLWSVLPLRKSLDIVFLMFQLGTIIRDRRYLVLDLVQFLQFYPRT